MSDELLPYYRRELDELMELAGAFGKAHPKIAARLGLTGEGVEDPHVSRLIESVAFLNARVRRKIDDDFPELTDGLLSVLYPHYLAPTPSMSIVQFECDRDLTSGYAVAAGTMIETDPVYGEPCRFRTTTPLTTWPIRVSRADLGGVPIQAPVSPHSSASVAVLRLEISTASEQTTLSELAPGSLRFYLHGAPALSGALYELLFNDVLGVAVATSPDDPDPILLGPDAIVPVGFGVDEGLLPYSPRSLPGYRLLTEFFCFPAKFLFFDIAGWTESKLEEAGGKLNLFFYLRRTTSDLEQTIDRDNFVLGCAPIVNLFPRRAEPIQLSQSESEVHVVPDARRPQAMEVFSIDGVRAASPRGGDMTFSPFYGVDHELEERDNQAYFTVQRKASPIVDGDRDSGTETYLGLVDLAFQPSAPADWVLDVETTCLNRNLPNQLPFGGDQPQLQFSDGGGPVDRIRCLTAPTPTRRPAMRHGARWRLISHLSLNHLSIADGPDGVAALKEILRLYDLAGSAENRALIESVLSIESQRTTLRTYVGGEPGFCRGTEVTITLDEGSFSANGLFLFATVLERFFGLYCTTNAFTQLVVKTNKREGELRRWSPRSGDVTLV